uniref:Putative secreted salivary protein n=1 Tax=Amblyomma cajennense TaxID=34607 RepID=A0A023FDN9_AMBCJ
MASKFIALCFLLMAVMATLTQAQHRPDTIRVPPPRIQLPKLPPPPRTRIDVQGGGSGSQHSVSGSIQHDIYRPARGPTISIWGQGSHQRHPATGSHGQGQVGVGVRIPIGKR